MVVVGAVVAAYESESFSGYLYPATRIGNGSCLPDRAQRLAVGQLLPDRDLTMIGWNVPGAAIRALFGICHCS